VVTQGPEHVIVWSGHGVKRFAVDQLPDDEIVDTNGAGDSFVGGFLSEIYQGNGIEQAVKTGCRLSREVIKRSGCAFPDYFEL